MNKQVLISNFHPANTEALCRDFRALGYKVIMPANNWDGRIHYYFDNSQFGNELITWEQYEKLPPGDVLIGCYEQEGSFRGIANRHGDRMILHVAGNNTPYSPGIKHLLSPDIQTYNNYDAPHKMLYWFPPVVYDLKKDSQASFDNGIIASYIHEYPLYWKESYQEAMRFEQEYGKIWLYGSNTRDGQLDHMSAQKRMVESKFTLYFKEKDCYGNTVLESMALGTPVIAMRRFIEDKTLGMFFLNNKNSIIVNNAKDAAIKARIITINHYQELIWNSKETIKTLTADGPRLKQMDALLSQN